MDPNPPVVTSAPKIAFLAQRLASNKLFIAVFAQFSSPFPNFGKHESLPQR